MDISIAVIVIVIIVMLLAIALITRYYRTIGGGGSGGDHSLAVMRDLIFCKDFINAETIDSYCKKVVKQNPKLAGITADQIKSFGIMELSMITKYHRDYSKLQPLKKSIKNTIFDHAYRIQINKEAYAFEVVVENKLKQITDIPFKNEQQLRAEGSQLTPDFLFSKDKPFIYEDKEVYWIDAKNYPCYDSKMTHFKLIAQSNKYTERFGQGMFVFNGIFKNIEIGDTIIFDYNAWLR